jgi:hypothetical protein
MWKWEGSPGQMRLATVGPLKIRLTRWNNCAGYGRTVGPLTVWYRKSYQQPLKGQLFLSLRPFKVGRRSLYFWLVWR